MNAELMELLQDLSEYMEQRGGGNKIWHNIEARLNMRIQQQLAKLEKIERDQAQIRTMSALVRSANS